MHRVTARRACNLIARACLAVIVGGAYLTIGWAIDKPGGGVALALIAVCVTWVTTLPVYNSKRGW